MTESMKIKWESFKGYVNRGLWEYIYTGRWAELFELLEVNVFRLHKPFDVQQTDLGSKKLFLLTIAPPRRLRIPTLSQSSSPAGTMQKSWTTSTSTAIWSACRCPRAPVGGAASTQRRRIQDVAITRTGKPIIRVQGGRSSGGGHTATVFGATGFLGRYIVNRLARQGCNVVIPFRDEYAKRYLKVAGDLGRIVFMEFDLRNTESIEESVRHSDIVYNLIGRDHTTKNFDYEDVHVEGTERIAEAVAKYNVDRFVQVSSYNADPNSSSEFFRTKARGEQVARSIFPETTIVRPAPIFGAEDRLLRRLAGATNVFTSNHMQQKLYPVHVR